MNIRNKILAKRDLKLSSCLYEFNRISGATINDVRRELIQVVEGWTKIDSVPETRIDRYSRNISEEVCEVLKSFGLPESGEGYFILSDFSSASWMSASWNNVFDFVFEYMNTSKTKELVLFDSCSKIAIGIYNEVDKLDFYFSRDFDFDF